MPSHHSHVTPENGNSTSKEMTTLRGPAGHPENAGNQRWTKELQGGHSDPTQGSLLPRLFKRCQEEWGRHEWGSPRECTIWSSAPVLGQMKRSFLIENRKPTLILPTHSVSTHSCVCTRAHMQTAACVRVYACVWICMPVGVKP